MPYIKAEQRTVFDNAMWCFPTIEIKGELEYCAYKLMLLYMRGRDETYTNLHDAVYALVHAAHEFERRRLDKREDLAITKNGDIII